MLGRVIPGNADAAAAKLQQEAEREGRTSSQVAASSLELYFALPVAVRAALRDIEALGTAEDRHNVLRSIARAVVSAQYEVARRRIAESMQLDNEDRMGSDEDILAEAVRVVAAGR